MSFFATRVLSAERTEKYDRAVKTCIDRARKYLIPSLSELSRDVHGGRLLFKLVAGEGTNQFVPIHLKAERNCVTNREMEGKNGMGAAIAVLDRETGTQLQLHGRIGRSWAELRKTTFTCQSIRLAEDDIGILREHAVLAVLADASWKPKRYAVAFVLDMKKAGKKAGLFKFHRTRRSSFKLNLPKMVFSPWRGGRLGFGLRPDGIGSRYVYGVDVCQAILLLMEDFGKTIKELQA